MKNIINLISIFLFVFSTQKVSAQEVSGEDKGRLAQVVEYLESSFKNGLIEYVFYNDLNRIKYFKVATDSDFSFLDIERGAAVYTEKYRKEVGAFRALDGAIWLAEGSASSVTPPKEALHGKKNDLIFHTHPNYGFQGARPSNGDLSTFRNDVDFKSSIITMDGYVWDYEYVLNERAKSTNIVAQKPRQILSPKNNKVADIKNKRISVLQEKYDLLDSYRDYIETDKISLDIVETIVEGIREVLGFVENSSFHNHTAYPKQEVFIKEVNNFLLRLEDKKNDMLSGPKKAASCKSKL